MPAIVVAALFSWLCQAAAANAPESAGGKRRAKRGASPIALGVSWMILGALPVAIVAQRFSAYYVSFSAVGFALLAAALLSRAPVWIAMAAFI